MDTLKILVSAYKPNSAPTNRVLSILHGMSELGINAEVFFAYPSKNSDKLDCNDIPHIQVVNLWDRYNCRFKLYKYLRSFWDVCHWMKLLPYRDKVLLFGSSEYLPMLVKRNDLRIYQERTEHPDVNPIKPISLQKRYLNVCEKISGMFVISTALKRVYERLGVRNIHVVNMTVDANRFSGIQKQEQQYPYIAYCGTALNNKDGVDQLIQAFSLVHKKYADIRLKIIGKAPGTNDVSGNVKLSNDLGLKDYVEFTGVVPSSEIPQLLVNATIVALDRPDSLQAQCGFPTKLGEYLLSGTPAVVTNVGDIPLFLKDGESALIAQHDNVQDFADKMIWVLEHPEESKVIGENGKQVALESFNYKNEARKIIDVIFGKE